MPRSEKTISQAECPECGVLIAMRRSLALDEVLLCPECDSLLRVIRLHPLEFAWALETGADTGRPDHDVTPGHDNPGSLA